MISKFTKATLCVLIAATTVTAGCKKENDPPPFNAVGYWRGQTYIYSAAILNRADGSSRLYFRIPGNDTARAETTLDGTYKLTNDGLDATYSYPTVIDQIVLDTYTADQNSITGLLVLATGEAITFDLRRQSNP